MVAAGNSRKELDTMKSRIILNRERTAKAQEISIPIHGKGGELGIKAEVTYMLQEYAGLAEGYCVMAIKVMGIVSETDTKGVQPDISTIVSMMS